MAIFRCLQRIIRNPNPNTCSKIRPIFSPFLCRSPFFSPSSSPHSRFLSPLSDVILSLHGPLFISSTTPWNLLQSATPLLVQSDVVLPSRRVEVFELLENAKLGFPIKLRFRDGGRENAKSGFPNELGFREDGRRASGVQDSELNDGGGFVRDFVNLPNLVSVSRLVSGPVLGWMIVNQWYLPAFVGLVVSGATDWLDGFLARRMGINSVVGSYLDPLADKVLIGCVALAMVENNLLHPGLVGLVVLRDVMLVGGAVYKRASSLHWEWKSSYDFFNLDGTRPEKVEPLFISKVNTVFQLILVAGALLQPDLGTPETQLYVTYLSWLVASTTVASTVAYGVKHFRNRPISIASSR